MDEVFVLQVFSGRVCSICGKIAASFFIQGKDIHFCISHTSEYGFRGDRFASVEGFISSEKTKLRHEVKK